jgi:hypothetical protein
LLDKIGTDETRAIKVFAKTENEVILGEDDKHLNFRVSLYLEQQTNGTIKKNLTVTTLAKISGRIHVTGKIT